MRTSELRLEMTRTVSSSSTRCLLWRSKTSSLGEDLGCLAQAVARAQALELVNRTSRARNRKRLHFARVVENVPEQGAEASRGASGQSSRWSHVGANLGRQQVGTDPRIDQLVSVKSDLSRSDQIQQPRQLFDPYPGEERQSYQNSGVRRYGVKSEVPRGNCYACGQMGHFAKEGSRKASVHLNYRGPANEKVPKNF